MDHAPAVCKKDIASMDYHKKSYSFAFVCPVCGKSQRANTNFLGARNVVCTGVKITKEAK